jgi:thiopeptide-type bacteriocin biosynthesis protein
MMIPGKHLPFNEWVYLKIYTGYSTSDRILKEILYPATMRAKKDGQVLNWFFIRYSDPDFHLRHRVKFRNPADGMKFIETINHGLRLFSEADLVWKVDMGTYIPETERYGTNTMKFTEDIFEADSEALVNFLIFSNTSRDARWLFAMDSVVHMLEDFEYSLDEKKNLLLHLSRNFGKEFGKNREVAQQLSARFRKKRRNILDSLDGGQNEILINRSEMIRRSVKMILRLYELNKLDVNKDDLLSSLIHMSMNRIFQTNNRLHEMVVYDFLFRYYKSLNYRN